MANKISAQNYPRINDKKHKYSGYLDESALKQHSYKISTDELKTIIIRSIENANKKSSRVILDIPDNSSSQDISAIYQAKGKDLFKYFQKYCHDPASTAHECFGRHYSDIGRELFKNRTLQKERMNSGWRYQYIAKDTAIISRRFISVSDIGTEEADFHVVISQNKNTENVNIYVSVKNRTNTMGGQDWPKAIRALEQVAKSDKNRTGPYICIFGIAMEKGIRQIKTENKTKSPYSINTEIWLSDFFWPFFSNCKYEEIIKIVLGVLIEKGECSLLVL